MNKIGTRCTGAWTLLAMFAMNASQAMTSLPHGSVMAAHSAKCLAIEDGATQSGARVVQAGCRHVASDQWQLQPSGNGYHRLIALGTGQCLTASGKSPSSGSQMVQSQCTNTRAQHWRLVSRQGGYTLKSALPRLCLDVSGVDRADGAAVILWRCNSGANQVFQFERRVFDDEAPVAIVGQQSGQCLNSSRASAAAGEQIVQWPCSGAADGSWTLKPEGDAVTVVNRQTGLCLDAGDSSQAGGAAVLQAACDSEANQRWRLTAFNGSWRYVAVHNGQCLGVNNGSTAPGAGLVQQPCQGKPNELWSMTMPARPAVWSEVQPTEIVTASAANLPDGRILGWAAYAKDNTTTAPMGHTWTELIDPVGGTTSVADVVHTRHDMFCPGTALLADGRLLVNGGADSKRTSLYDPATGTWTAGAEMRFGRGYQGTVMNADGSVLTLGGSWSGGTPGNRIGELWTQAGGWKPLWSVLADPVMTADAQGPYRADNHLWLHVLSGGRLLHAGPSKQMNWIDPYANGGAGLIWKAGLRGDDADSMNGNSVQYDVGKILKLGGAPSYGHDNVGFNATASVQVIDATEATLSVQRVAPMAYARAFHNSVVLPSGQVMVLGGQTVALPFSDTNAVLAPELWDPDARVFERLPPMATPRNYHSVALLLPDARVWVAGGGVCGTCATNHPDYEIITPPYLLKDDGTPATRPAITEVETPVTPVGEVLRVTTSAPVASFALVRLSAVSHSVNGDQRRIPLFASTEDGSHYEMTLPTDPGIVVPGFYMLFALNATGVPSVASTVQVTPR